MRQGLINNIPIRTLQGPSSYITRQMRTRTEIQPECELTILQLPTAHVNYNTGDGRIN